MSDWIPAPGDIVWIDFSPTEGTEQSGRRPALVLSNQDYNEISGRAVVAPVTSKIRGWTLEVVLPENAPVSGAVLIEHVRSIDWRARFAKSAGSVSADVLDTARAKLRALVGLG